MFHCLAQTSADLLIGGAGSVRSRHAWLEVYRALAHGSAKSACEDPRLARFPTAVRDFANKFVEMQKKRHDADYNPYAKFYRSDLMADIAAVELIVDSFQKVPVTDRRAFASFVLFRNTRRV